MTPLKYISSIDFIRTLEYERMEIYSFQRGIEFEENTKALQTEFDKLKTRKAKRPLLDADAGVRYAELDNLLNAPQYLLNEAKRFHPSSVRIAAFTREDPKSRELESILRTEIINIPSWMCAPVYRDAVVFYDRRSSIVSALHVCLTCETMAFDRFVHIQANEKAYALFRQFFTDIGHAVGDEF